MTEPTYFDDLLRAYEGEVGGEAYFKALTAVFPEPSQCEKLMLLAAVEKRTGNALRPLIQRHGLAPLDNAALIARGERFVVERAFGSWSDLIANMTTRYPGFIDKFSALAAVGPAEDKGALETLVEHEVALLAFARHEAAGDGNSLVPVRAYLTESGS